MTDLTTPVPADTNLGPIIGGQLHGPALLRDPSGADAMGLVSGPDAGTLLGLLTAIAANQAAMALVGTETYSLAANAALTAGSSGPWVTVPRGGYFFFDAAFTGSSPSLKLQRLGADGATPIDVVTRTAVGSGDPVGIPNGSQVRVTNAGAGTLTAVSAVLG